MFCPGSRGTPLVVGVGNYTTPIASDVSRRTGQAACQAGSHCTGDGARVACPAGRFGSATGLSTPACSGDCSPGHYGSGTGYTAATCAGTCTAAYYCPSGSVSAQQVPCPAGRWGRAGEVNASCAGECSAGYACPPASASPTQRLCGGTSFYCPGGASEALPAALGFYTTPETPDTELTRTGVVVCDTGFYCPGDGRRHVCPVRA